MLYCVLIESPEVLNIIQENHIKSIISLLDKHGRNHKVGIIFSVALAGVPACSFSDSADFETHSLSATRWEFVLVQLCSI